MIYLYPRKKVSLSGLGCQRMRAMALVILTSCLIPGQQRRSSFITRYRREIKTMTVALFNARLLRECCGASNFIITMCATGLTAILPNLNRQRKGYTGGTANG